LEKKAILGGWLMRSALEEPLADWGVLMDDGAIETVGPNAEIRRLVDPGRIEDATSCVVMPGFCDAHMHMYGVLSHGIKVPSAFKDLGGFLKDFWWPLVEDRIDHELIRVTTSHACYEMIQSGVTSFMDVLEAPNSLPGCLRVEAEVVRGTGLRGVLSFEASERMGPELAKAGLEENRRFVAENSSANCSAGGLIRGMMCIHTTFSCSPSYISEARAISKDLGCSIHMHLSEGNYEPEQCLENSGKRPVELYRDLDYLGPDVLASQSVQVTPAEVDIMARHGVAVCHMPLSNCEVGAGIAPVPDMLKRGMRVGLGSDGYVTDFFQVMRGAFLIHKAYRQDAGVMPASQVVDMATRAGPAIIGFERTGLLQEGFRADVIAVDLSHLPTPVLAHNLVDQLLLYCGPHDVKSVMVDGRYLKKDGRVLVLDGPAVRQRTREAARKFWSEAGGIR